MKKLLILILALVLSLSLFSCKGSSENLLGGLLNALDGQEADGEWGEDHNTEASALRAFKLFGMEKSAIEPDWSYETSNPIGDKAQGTINFMKKDGELSVEEYEIWFKKIFDATAKASDDGYNIQGFTFGTGEEKKTWEEVSSGESLITSWAYKYKGVIMDVYVDRVQNPEAGDEYIYDEDTGEYKWVYHKIGVSLNITQGLQKGWDDAIAELEDIFGGILK